MNKGTDKQYVAVLLLQNTTNHYQALIYPCIISLLYLDLYVLGDDALIS